MGCKNPLLAEERQREHEDLLRATERELETVVAAVGRAKRPLRGREKIGLRVGRVLGRFKVAKHYRLEITDEAFSYARDEHPRRGGAGRALRDPHQRGP